jgi:hypothetical protein
MATKLQLLQAALSRMCGLARRCGLASPAVLASDSNIDLKIEELEARLASVLSELEKLLDPQERGILASLSRSHSRPMAMELVADSPGGPLERAALLRPAPTLRALRDDAPVKPLRQTASPPSRTVSPPALPKLTVIELARQISAERKLPMSSAMCVADDIARHNAKHTGKRAYRPMRRSE